MTNVRPLLSIAPPLPAFLPTALLVLSEKVLLVTVSASELSV
jgi:hypothetical protein